MICFMLFFLNYSPQFFLDYPSALYILVGLTQIKLNLELYDRKKEFFNNYVKHIMIYKD